MRRAVHLMPVGISGIPRADTEIQRTVETFRTVQYEQDPLLDAAESFRHSLIDSAKKREGAVLEAAIMDAIEATKHLRLVGVNKQLSRRPDVQFEALATGWMVALEVKRGSNHDSTKIRQFRSDLLAIPTLLRTALPLFPEECIHFHILFLSGRPPIREGVRPVDLAELYDLHITSHVQTARQRYIAAIRAVLRERGC